MKIKTALTLLCFLSCSVDPAKAFGQNNENGNGNNNKSQTANENEEQNSVEELSNTCEIQFTHSGPFDFTAGSSYKCAGGFKIEDAALPNDPIESEWKYYPSEGCAIAIVPTEWKDNELITFDYSIEGDCTFDNVEVKWSTIYYLYDTNCAPYGSCLGSQVHPDPKTGNINGISHIQFCPAVEESCDGSSFPPPATTPTEPTQSTASSGPTEATEPTQPARPSSATSTNSNPTPLPPSSPTEPTSTYEPPGNGGNSAESCTYSQCEVSLSHRLGENRFQGGWNCPNNNGFKIDENMPRDPSLSEYTYPVTIGGDWGEDCKITLKNLIWKEDELVEFGYSVEGDCCVHQTEVKYGPMYVTYDYGSFIIPFGEEDACLRSSGCKGISHIQFCPAISCEYPSTIPSTMPSLSPSESPSSVPSRVPSDIPSDKPSEVPSDVPSDIPSNKPSVVPSAVPSYVPSNAPSDVPTDEPSDKPSEIPSITPSQVPSGAPSMSPPTSTITSPNEVPLINLTGGHEACYQSTTGHGGVCERALDGNWSGIYGHLSTTHTLAQLQPWWMVDLGRFAAIKQIVFGNREDCCWHRLRNIKIEIMLSIAGPIIYEKILDGVQDRLTAVDIDESIVGRVVKITSVNTALNFLSLSEVAVYGQEIEQQPNDEQQVAIISQGKDCFQSSTIHGGVCSRALDGNLSGMYGHKSTTHTGPSKKPWWLVDLGKFYDISSIVLANREDCCSHRLQNVDIEILTSLSGAQSGAKYLPGVQDRISAAFFDVPVSGRYVKVTSTHTNNNYLSLAEVVVRGTESVEQPTLLPNVALNSPFVLQSTTVHGGVALRAIDGNTNGNWSNLSVTHTAPEEKPFWIVYIGPTIVKEIILWNRKDCCSGRLSNVIVSLYSDIECQQLVEEKAIASSVGPVGGVTFDSLEAAAVKIHMNSGSPDKKVILSLAEVEILGEPLQGGIKLQNVALYKSASQSSTAFGGEASRAVDGDTSTPWHTQTLTHTGNQANPWWKVDLGLSYAIYDVLFVNRSDCCWDRLTSPIIEILDENDSVIAEKLYQGQVPRGGVGRVSFDGHFGCKVRVSVKGENQVLTLAEVVVLADLEASPPTTITSPNEIPSPTPPSPAGTISPSIAPTISAFPTFSIPPEIPEDSIQFARYDRSSWTLVFGQGIFTPQPKGEVTDPETFKNMVKAKPNMIVRRLCPTCKDWSHKDIYYRRITPIPVEMDFMDLFKDYWHECGNHLNHDFALYSTYDDALNDTNRWKFCDFNYVNVGFPRNCGPNGRVWNNYSSFKRPNPPTTGNHVAFLIENRDGAKGVALPVPAQVVTYDENKWDLVFGRCSFTSESQDSLTDESFKALVLSKPNQIVRRVCPFCQEESHRDIYYRRITPIPEGFRMLDVFKNNWQSADNSLNQDFALYSTYDDALNDTNRWKFCNYNYRKIGFPHDCGPTRRTARQWGSYIWGDLVGYGRTEQLDFGFLVEKNAPSMAVTAPSWEKAPAESYYDPTQWKLSFGTGIFQCKPGEEITTSNDLKGLISQTKTQIIWRRCNYCWHPSHINVYYRRLTAIPDGLDFLDLFKNNWVNQPGNMLNVDFALYSSFTDAINDTRRWGFCNYNVGGVGFPRECGLNRNWFLWSSFNKPSPADTDFGFFVYTGDMDAVNKGPTSPPSAAPSLDQTATNFCESDKIDGNIAGLIDGPFDTTSNEQTFPTCQGRYTIEGDSMPNNRFYDNWKYDVSEGCTITIFRTV